MKARLAVFRGVANSLAEPRPGRLAFKAADAAFVAGSGYDLIGTARVGLRTYWHNRVGLPRPPGAPPAALESSGLEGLVPWLEDLE